MINDSAKNKVSYSAKPTTIPVVAHFLKGFPDSIYTAISAGLANIWKITSTARTCQRRAEIDDPDKIRKCIKFVLSGHQRVPAISQER